MSNIVSKLIKIANKLDSLHLFDEAAELDSILRLAAKDKAELESQMQDIDSRMSDPNTPPERLRELNEAKQNIERELAALTPEEEAPTGDTTIGVNDFVTRQTADSKFGHYDGSFEDVAALAKQNFGSAKPGYRDGVVLVSVPPEGFYSSIVELTPGTQLTATYAARREGEDPYMQLSVPPEGQQKSPAKTVDIVLYSKETMAEGNENTTDADWEVISINASPWADESGQGESEPMQPEALMRNYFQEGGGTATNMSTDEFVKELKRSRDFWRNKAMLG